MLPTREFLPARSTLSTCPAGAFFGSAKAIGYGVGTDLSERVAYGPLEIETQQLHSLQCIGRDERFQALKTLQIRVTRERCHDVERSTRSALQILDILVAERVMFQLSLT